MTAPRANAPPLRLPGEHFAAGLGFLIAGGIGLWLVAPALAAGAYPAPAVIVVTHLFTLGWLTTSIMGALYQFLPVALDRPIASEALAHTTFGLHVTGVIAMVTGIGTGNAVTLGAGVALLAAGILGFLGNLTVTLHRAPRRGLTWWALAGAAVFLGVTLAFGAALAINRSTGALGAAHDIVLRVHLHAGLFGWVLLVVVGVSHRLLPMFLLSHGGGERAGWWAVRLIVAGAAALTLLHHFRLVGAELPLVLLSAGLVAWVIQARIYFRHRHRPRLDPGLRLSAIAAVVLALVPLALLRFLFPHATASFRTLYVGLLVFGTALFVAAQYYKIVPFLIWNRHFGPLAGTRPLPRVADLYTTGQATAAVVLLAAGAALVLAGIGTSIAGGVRVGALLFLLGAAVEARQLWSVSRRRP